MRRILPFLLACLSMAAATPVHADPVDVVCSTVRALGCRTYYRDADGDRYGDPATAHRSPVEPSGEVSQGDDCDDNDPAVYPGAVESFNGRDDDCDGLTDEVVLVVSELMVNPKSVADTAGEWIEVANTSGEPVRLGGVTLAVGTRSCALGGELAAAGRLVVARSADPAVNGGVEADVTCTFTLTNTGTSVRLATVSKTLDGVDYTGFGVPDGASLSLDPGSHDPVSNDAAGSWCPATSVFGAGDRGTPGAPNDNCA